MSEYEFSKNEMFEPIQRLFEREYSEAAGYFDDLNEDEDGLDELIDLAFVGGDRENFHAARLEASYDACVYDVGGGIHSLSDVKANYRWLALSLDEFREGDKTHSGILKEECKKRGIGIITIQPKGRGVSAKVLLEPNRQEGDFLEKYPSLDNRWKAFADSQLVGEEYKVVNYYDRS